jgi:hypothetical protein
VYREQSRLLESHLCPVDQRIQAFLDDVLKTTGESVKLPSNTLNADRFGLARELSFPEGGIEFQNSEIKSYRLAKGSVLHNPINDKRTTKAAGWIGPKYNVKHDISLLVPELWCRMTPQERDPNYLIQHKYLEPVGDFEYEGHDFEYEGRTIPASRLGYRITKKFVNYFFCRVFDNPSGVFTTDMLQPKTQDLAVYVDGIENIAQAMETSAKLYFDDGIINDTCHPCERFSMPWHMVTTMASPSRILKFSRCLLEIP